MLKIAGTCLRFGRAAWLVPQKKEQNDGASPVPSQRLPELALAAHTAPNEGVYLKCCSATSWNQRIFPELEGNHEVQLQWLPNIPSPCKGFACLWRRKGAALWALKPRDSSCLFSFLPLHPTSEATHLILICHKSQEKPLISKHRGSGISCTI